MLTSQQNKFLLIILYYFNYNYEIEKQIDLKMEEFRKNQEFLKIQRFKEVNPRAARRQLENF